MSRADFLRELREALAGEVSPSVIEENLRYYDGYIAQEAAKGRSEAEVIEEIGGPRIIARTIIDSQGGGWEESGGYQGSGAYEQSGGYYRETDGREETDGYRRGFTVDLNKWYWKFLAAAAVILVLLLVVLGLAGLLFLAVRIVFPLLAIAAVVWLVKSLFRRL